MRNSRRQSIPESFMSVLVCTAVVMGLGYRHVSAAKAK